MELKIQAGKSTGASWSAPCEQHPVQLLPRQEEAERSVSKGYVFRAKGAGWFRHLLPLRAQYKTCHPIIPDCHLQEHVQTPYRAPCTFHGLSPVCSSVLPSGMLFPGSCLRFQTCLLCGPLPSRSALPSATWLLPTYALTLHMFWLLWKLSLTGLDPQNILVVVVPQHLLHYM